MDEALVEKCSGFNRKTSNEKGQLLVSTICIELKNKNKMC